MGRKRRVRGDSGSVSVIAAVTGVLASKTRRALTWLGLTACVTSQLFLILAALVFIPFDEVSEGGKFGEKIACLAVAAMLFGPELLLLRWNRRGRRN